MTLSAIVFWIILCVVIIGGIVLDIELNDNGPALTIVLVVVWIFVGVYFVYGNDWWASVNLKYIDHKITKLEQKIEKSDIDYDKMRFQTKINYWNKHRKFYIGNIEISNNESIKEK